MLHARDEVLHLHSYSATQLLAPC